MMKPLAANRPVYSKQQLRDVVGWDIATWKYVLSFWDDRVADFSGKRALEIGANTGGLSLHFALKGCDVVCSDIVDPPQSAIELHERYGLNEQIAYRSIDATNIEMPDESLDIVCFKSVLGGVGRGDRIDRLQKAVTEMFRVLKPGGRLLFAENLVASSIHRQMRRKFVPWGRDWRYVTLDELSTLLSAFSHVDLTARGFFSAFGRSEFQRDVLHLIDLVIEPLLRDSAKYVAIGCAVK